MRSTTTTVTYTCDRCDRTEAAYQHEEIKRFVGWSSLTAKYRGGESVLFTLPRQKNSAGGVVISTEPTLCPSCITELQSFVRGKPNAL